MIKIRQLIEGTTVAILIVDLTGRIVRAEKQGQNGWETNLGSLKGSLITDLFGNFPELTQGFKQARENQPLTESVITGGKLVNAHFSPITGPNGQVSAINCIFTIKEPPGGFESAPGRAILYQKIVEEAIDVVYITDRHGNFTYVNPPAQMLTGFSPEELIGMHFTRLISNDWRDRVSKFYIDQYESRVQETSLEFPIRRRDGSERWVEQTVRLITDNDRATGFQSIARDIDTRKKAEQALEESEDQYRSLVELSPVAITVHRAGKLIYVNPASLKLFDAKTPEEILARPLLSFIHPDYRDVVIERIQKSYENRQAAPPLVEKMIRLDGAVIEVEVTSQPIVYQGEQATQVVINDISNQKRAREELQRYADRLEIQNEIDQAILMARSSREVAQVVTERIRKLVPCERVTVTLFDMQHGEAIVIASELETEQGSGEESRFPLHGGYPKNLLEKEFLLVEDINSEHEPNEMEKRLLAMGIHTFINIPLMVRGDLVGSLNLGAAEPGNFSPEYIQIARELAGSLAVAIEQVRLYEEVNLHANQLEERVRELNDSERYLALLNEITKISISVDNLETLLQILEARLGELFGADTCSIILLNGDPREEHAGIQDKEGQTAYKPKSSLQSIAVSALDFGKAIYWGEGDSEGSVVHAASSPKHISFLSLPLIAGDQQLGAALIAFEDPRPIAEEDIGKGEQAAAQIALAVAKASLLDSERRRRQEAETLRTVSNALASTLDLQQVLDIILDQLAVVIGYDSSAILLWEGDVVKAVAGRGFRDYSLSIGEEFPLENWLFDEIQRTLKPVWLSNPNEDPRFIGWGGTKDIRSWMGLPLIVHGKLIGFMTLDSFVTDAYGASQAALVQPFANQAAQAIENASLFDWVQRQAVTDALTNVYNRRGFFELGQREVDRALRFNRELVAVMLDIDLFKQVNDRVGHAIGDQVLIEIAERCVQVLRRVDLIGRYGGEEFAILLPETEQESAAGVAERLRQAIAESPINTDRGPIPVTISLGVASVNPAVRDLAGLLDAADTAMYAAKQAGRNCVKVYQW